MLDPATRTQLMKPIERLAVRAGAEILTLVESGITHDTKPDGSPVTNADTAADAIILEGLCDLTPEWQAITEESWQGTPPPNDAPYWCVDPLDGTNGFLNGGKDYTVNIALIHENYPVLGVIVAPARGMLWASDGAAAWTYGLQNSEEELRPIQARICNTADPIVITTRSRRGRSDIFDAWLKRLAPSNTISAGSSLKFCHLAAGIADFYPRISPTMEWDTAAGQAILEAAGGAIIDSKGARFSYGKAGLKNSHFAAMGRLNAPIPAAWHPPAGDEAGR